MLKLVQTLPQAFGVVPEQIQLPPEKTWSVPHAVSFTQCPLVSHFWGTPPALHFLSTPGVQSAQALVLERQIVQVWVLCEQVP